MSAAAHRPKPFLIATLTGIGILALVATPAAAVERISKTWIGGHAVGGFDATAYFDVGEPEDGSDSFTYEWQGAVWRFASAEDRNRFAADPEAFAPQFGGHCANGLAEDHVVSGNPGNWMIVDDKLYLFHLPRGERIWTNAADVSVLIDRAAARWAEYLATGRR